MIEMTMKSGPFANTRRDVTNEDPVSLFDSLVLHMWKWEVHYEKATPDEESLWRMHDVSSRMILALLEGRKVFIGDKVFVGFEESWEAISDEMEGLLITMEYDDSRGVKVGIADYEH